MANVTRAVALTRANEIRTETNENANSAERVGSLLRDMVESCRFDNGSASLTGAANTLALTHADKMVGVSHGSATSLTVPPNADVAFAVGTRIELVAEGAGAVTVVAGSGVTVRCALTLELRAQWSKAELVKRGTNEWLLSGDLEP